VGLSFSQRLRVEAAGQFGRGASNEQGQLQINYQGCEFEKVGRWRFHPVVDARARVQVRFHIGARARSGLLRLFMGYHNQASP
jgi:hypothetical protein